MADIAHIAIPGGRIEYRWIGERAGDKPVLVFLHEGLGCIALWRDFPDQIAAAAGLPALVYSRFGYGGSDACALPRPITYMHDEAQTHLPALLAALGIRRHILVGHSDGASIALIYGAGHRPDLAGLALMAPHSFCEEISVRSIAAAGENYRTGDLRAKLARYHGANVDCAFRGWCDAWLDPTFRHWNIEEHVARVTVPVLVIQGEGDEYGTASQVEVIAQRAAGPVETCLLPACGHSPHRDQPAQALAKIVGFLKKISNRQ